MNSMTGYGKADFKNRQMALSVTVTSVNGRFLDCILRLPRQIGFLEPKVRELIGQQINRGKVTLILNYDDFGIGLDRLNINVGLAEELFKHLTKLKKKYKLAGEIEIGHFIGFPELFKLGKTEDIEDQVWGFAERTINKALKDMIFMRQREGLNLSKDLDSRLKILDKTIVRIEKLAKENIPIYREKLGKKIDEVLDGKTSNSLRLEEEIVFYAERSDITEECIRFKSHIKQFSADIKRKGAIGKRLNFILQELNREANTMGAKNSHNKIAPLVLTLKEEIEKMREQVQNIE